jgi:hypothetical protein
MTNGSRYAEPSRLFEKLWLAMVQMIGTAATAALLYRAARYGAAEFPELAELEVHEVGLDYEYRLPGAWANQRQNGWPPSFAHLVRSRLVPILRELTGQVVIQRLRQERDLAPLLEGEGSP